MTKNKWLLVPAHNTRLIMRCLVVLITLFVSACSGGISGTGDGGPRIIDTNGSVSNVQDNSVDGDTDSTNTAADPVPVDSVGSDNTSSGDASPDAAPDNAIVLPELSTVLPIALLNSISNSDSISSSEVFTRQLVSATDELANITAVATNSLNAESINTDLAGFFDNSIEITSADTTTLIRWTLDSTLRSLFSATASHLLYVLQEDSNITVRRVDLINNTVFNANLLTRPTDTVIEAALNANGLQRYLSSLSTVTETTVFTQHPSDDAARQREMIDQTGAITIAQSCDPTNAQNNCTTDTDWTLVAGDNIASTDFVGAGNRITEALNSIDPVVSSIPDSVTQAVIASSDSENLAPETIQCGIQRVSNSIRSFCIEPLPLESAGNLFEETLSGGQIFYMRQ